MKEQMKDTKKGLTKFLNERMKWFIDYGNPFQEAQMVFYISNGLLELGKLEVSDETEIVMWDEDGVLKFRVEA